MPYFDDTLTLDEAKQLYRRLARQHHPDILKDDGVTMTAINTEYEQFKLRKERPAIGVAAPAPGADPMAWFAAMKAAVQAAATAPPEVLQQASRQAAAHRPPQPPPAYMAAAATPPWSPPPAPSSTPPASQPSPAGAASSTATATRTRRTKTYVSGASTSPSQPRQSAAQRIAAKEESDYQNARWEPKDKFNTRRSGDVVIFWEDTSYDRLECVAILTPSNPRHEIRRNGLVVHSEPATRKWQAERKDVIDRARKMI